MVGQLGSWDGTGEFHAVGDVQCVGQRLQHLQPGPTAYDPQRERQLGTPPLQDGQRLQQHVVAFVLGVAVEAAHGEDRMPLDAGSLWQGRKTVDIDRVVDDFRRGVGSKERRHQVSRIPTDGDESIGSLEEFSISRPLDPPHFAAVQPCNHGRRVLQRGYRAEHLWERMAVGRDDQVGPGGKAAEFPHGVKHRDAVRKRARNAIGGRGPNDAVAVLVHNTMLMNGRTLHLVPCVCKYLGDCGRDDLQAADRAETVAGQ